MDISKDKLSLTPALEDYLETIYLIVQEKKIARVKEIARSRGVRMASVSPAMRRLSDLGLIAYSQREFIDLTPAGEEIARRTLARHDLLTRFFTEILQMNPHNAESDACAMEHHLSDEGMDKLTRFFEFVQLYPTGIDNFIERFHNCSLVNPEIGRCTGHGFPEMEKYQHEQESGRSKLSEMEAGTKAAVLRINARGRVREKLLNIGILPGVTIEMLHRNDTAEPSYEVSFGATTLLLLQNEAEAVIVTLQK